MLTQVLINSIDVSSYLVNYESEKAYGDVIASVDIKTVRSIINILDLAEGMTVVIWRGWVTATEEKIFSGYIQQFVVEGGTIKISVNDKLWDLVRKEVNHIYDSTIDASAGKISEIFKDLITTYGGLTADGTSVQDSGTAITLSKFRCNHTDIMERCKKLAEALDWQFYYRADTDKVYFEPKGFTNNSTPLVVGSNIIQIPKWNYDITEMVNDLTVEGGSQEVETTESGQIDVTAGYTTTSILLSYEPLSVKVYGDAGNPPTTLKVGGVPDSTATYNYSVDKNQKKIYPAAGTTFTTNHFFEIRYSLIAPIPIHLVNKSSKDSYGDFKKTITYNDIKTISDAETRAMNYLAKYSTPFIYTTLKVKNVSTYGLAVGQMVQVIDNKSLPTVNSSLVINRHRLRWPTDYDEFDVGDRYWRLQEFQSKVMEKLKRLEEEEFANQDIINELVTVDNRIVNPIVVKPRYFKVTKKTGTVGTDNFVIGTSKLGTGYIGDFGALSEVNHTIYQYLNTYTEYFFDDDFKSGSTTATWNTTNKYLAMTTGEIGQSLTIDYANGTTTTATITVTAHSDTNLVGHYILNGDSLDMSGNGKDGTDTAVTYLDGKIDRAGVFDGATSKIIIGANTDFSFDYTDSFSISAWIKATDLLGYYIIVGKQETAANYRGYWFGVRQTTGYLHFEMINTATSNELIVWATDNAIVAGVWTHVAVTYNGSYSAAGVKLYINGVLQTKNTYADTLNATTINTIVPQISGRNGANFCFKGSIDDVRFYSSVLSQANVTSLYNSGSGTEASIGSANYTLSLTANGGTNWETATSGTAHAFTNTGTDLRWKITATGTALFKKVEIKDYH